MVDKCDIEYPQAALATRRVNVLAAMLQIENLRLAIFKRKGLGNIAPRMFMRMFKFTPVFDVLAIAIRIGGSVQRTADNRLRLVTLRHYNRFKTMLACGHEAVFANKIGKASSLHR